MNNEPSQDVNPANVDMTPNRLAQEKARIEAGLGGLPIIPKTEEVPVLEEDLCNPKLITSKNVLELTAPDTKVSEENIKPEIFTPLTPDELNVETTTITDTPPTTTTVTPEYTPTTTTTPDTVPPTTFHPPLTTTPPTTTTTTTSPKDYDPGTSHPGGWN
jgi:hypothetical protein